MMQKLRRKFILIAMAALAVTMILVTGAVNLANWLNVRGEIGETVDFLAESDGMVTQERANAWAGRSRHRRDVLTRSVYFVARTGKNSDRQITGRDRNESVSNDEADSLLERAAASGRDSGFLDDYFYRKYSDRGGSSFWVFLNCESYLSATRNLLVFSAAACAAGMLLALLAVSLFSRRAIEPLLRNERKQKRFITDASHELKAPLAVISANMDVLALNDEENPWINGTRSQVASMRRLVEDMVYLSRVDEAGRPPDPQVLQLG